jgi:hypothetical protein
MSTDIKDITDRVEEVAFGAADAAAKVASDPMGTVRKQVKGLERKGTPAARRVNRRFNARLNAATAPAKDAAKTINARLHKARKQAEKVANGLRPERLTVWGFDVNGKLPEKVAIKGLHLVKVQAHRQDVVGDVAKRALRIFNGSFKTIAKAATRLEHATETREAATTKSPAASKPATRTATKPRRVRRTAARRRAA